VKDVQHAVQNVDDAVQGVETGVRASVIKSRVSPIKFEVSTTKWITSTVRSLPKSFLPLLNPHASPQGTNCETAFELGFPLRIHPQIITLPARLITRDRLNGSSVVAFTSSGSPPVLSYGYMENVRFRHTVFHPTSFDRRQSHSGVGKEHTLVRLSLSPFPSRDLHGHIALG
jgi:hypothetical protein